MKAKALLWLDDIRNPFLGDWLLQFAPEYDERRDFVHWVKNYDEFESFIKGYGVPDKIGFDHDLGYGKDGMDCARFLVNHCQERKLPLPKWVIQSANPVGADNIDGLLKSFKKFQNGGH